ncbi:adaptin N terminal region-domain-containing protein [Phellopilus nigrolimitatus]|nr:adaptin N terminal region-domain-containing protein [Phellopilus nigrolimitatus]
MATGLNLNSFTENTSRLGARISESIIEHTRDLAITRSPGSYFDAPEEKVRGVRKQLDANGDREKLDALKTLIALISKGRNVSEFFPSVVKNVASQNLEIRKLVYIFLLRYAEAEPDLALLSINTFQRDLADPNPLIRAMALRVLSGINVPMVGNLVVLAVKKCAADPSPYVRKAAALALIKCYNMDTTHLSSLIPILATLLKDKSPLSIGAAAVAFQAICPARLDLLHAHFRRLCRMLLDADAWGQVSVLGLLARYARCMLTKPSATFAVEEETEREEVDPDLQLLLTSAEPLLMSRNPAVVLAVARAFFYLSPSSQLAKTVNPLLRLLPTSREVERVVLACFVVISRDAPQLLVPHYSRFFIRTTDIREVKRDKLRVLLKLLTPENHQVLLREFVVYAEDPDGQIVSEAIQAIGRCARIIPESLTQCLSAFMDFIKHGSDSAVSSSVLVLRTLVQTRLQTEPGASLTTTSAHSPLRIIADLAGRIDEIRHPSARACVIWLVGQYAALGAEDSNKPNLGDGGVSCVAWWAPDVLRRVAKTYSTEAPIVKLQLLTLAAKLQVLSSSNHHALALLTRYVFLLARYDASYDVRDRVRILSGLFIGVTPQSQHPNGDRHSDGDFSDEADVLDRGGVILRLEQVKLVLFEGKVGIRGKKEIFSGKLNRLGHGNEFEPPSSEWLEEGTESSLRDTEDEYPTLRVTAQAAQRNLSAVAGGIENLGPSHVISSSTPVALTSSGRASPGTQGKPKNKGPWMDLDKFYEDSESEDDEEDEEEDDDDDDDDGDDGDEDQSKEDETRTKSDLTANYSQVVTDETEDEDDGESSEDAYDYSHDSHSA